MTIDRDNAKTRDELRIAAANWFAILRGPEPDARRAEFEAWLADKPAHRAAYSRIVETFSLGKGLRGKIEERPERPSVVHRPTRRKLTVIATSVGLAGTLLLLSDYMAPLTHAVRGPDAIQHEVAARPPSSPVQIATNVGQIRTFALPDGSLATLDTDSRLVQAFTLGERSLRLLRGRARFTVAHEARPFVVRAGDTAVTARGTIFDVDLTTVTTVVHLLRGKVDVRTTRAGHAPVTTRLIAGDRLSFDGKLAVPVTAHAGSIDNGWPSGAREVDRIRLADLVLDANRYATTPIVLGSADLSAMRLSGTFHLSDTTRVAENIAIVLGLAVTTTSGAITLSRTCRGADEKNCRMPS
jgi:transmembrane sensor